MEIYFAILIVIGFFSMLEVASVNILMQKLVLIFFSSICLLLGGIRYNIGTDWESYYSFFIQGDSIDYFINQDSFEVGYALLNYVIKYLTNEYNALLLLISFICVMCFYNCSVCLAKYSITVTMILYASEFYGIFPVRTTIVAAMAMLSYVLIEKKQKYYFIILVFMATSIHRIAIVLLPAYWVYYRQWNNKRIVVFIILSIFIGYTNIIFDFISSLTGVDSAYISKFISYAERNASGSQFGSAIDKNELSYYMIALKCFMLVVFLKYRSLLKSRIKHFDGLFNIFMFGNCVYFSLVFISTEIATRLTSVYVVSQYLLMGELLNLGRRINVRLLLWLGLFLMCVMKVYMKFKMFPDAYVPYVNILGI